MLLVERRCDGSPAPDDRLVLPFELRCKSRLRTRLASGAEVGVFLPRGTVLRDGDCLQADDGRVVRVEAAPERCLRIDAAGTALVRAAYHLGNRHVPLQIGDGWLRLEFDSVLAEMLRGLGLDPVEETATFEPEAGAYGHRHDAGSRLRDG